jgi:predicted cobalt transporter CbtA
VDRFRSLATVILLSGTIAGLLLFTVEHYTTFPLIEKAEVYESAAQHRENDAHHHEDDEGWRPAEGERTLFTAVTTMLTAIGFAGMLFGVIALKPFALDWRRGALWGLAAYVCIDLAPGVRTSPTTSSGGRCRSLCASALVVRYRGEYSGRTIVAFFNEEAVDQSEDCCIGGSAIGN